MNKSLMFLTVVVLMTVAVVKSIRISNSCTKAARRCIRQMPLDRTSKVCGTDGVTYKSVCLLEMKACMHQTPIMVAYEGGCRPLQAANQQLQNHVSQGDWGQRPHQQQGREGDSSSEESDESSEERSAGRPPTRTPFIPQTIAPTRRILYDRVTIPPQVPESSTTPYYSTMIPEGCPETCPIQDLPVCGSDGVTYGSPCLFKAQSCRPEGSGLTAVYAGACIPTCGSECEALYDPVCGTDGTTYNSVCVLDQTSCRLEDETLTVAYRGECFNTLRDRDCQQECEDFIEPVCTDTGMTYKSRCEFERYQCVTRDSTERIASKGACPGTSLECYENCPDMLFPVCASNHVTYPSLCHYGIAKCKDSNVTYEYSGPCLNTTADPCDAECTLSMKPVCASNDATYFNRCFLTLAACKDPEIEYVKDGHCNASTTKSTQG